MPSTSEGDAAHKILVPRTHTPGIAGTVRGTEQPQELPNVSLAGRHPVAGDGKRPLAPTTGWGDQLPRHDVFPSVKAKATDKRVAPRPTMKVSPVITA